MGVNVHRDYPCHPANHQGARRGGVSFLVIHYVGAHGDARQNARYYHSTPGIGASAHYFVGHAQDGADVWQSVPEDCVASHCGRRDGRYKHPACRNANSIGIEMCCHQRADGTWYFDPETIARTAELARALMARYGIDTEHVLRHYDVTGKTCPAPFVLDGGAWTEFKARFEGEIDVTREEIQEMVDRAVVAAVQAAQPEVYTTVEEVPEWAQETVGRAVKAGALKGDAAGKLYLTMDNLVNLQVLENLKLLL